MTKEECSTCVSDSKIKFEEKRRSVVFVNVGKDCFYKIKVDGCMVKNALAADWVLSKKGLGDIIIELKGKDVEHALRQIDATARLWHESQYRVGLMSALIVAREYPKATSKVLRAKAEFAKRYKGALHIVCSYKEFSFNDVLGMKAPD